MVINFLLSNVPPMPVNEKINYDLLVITGPTASGKTSLAVAVASRVGGEIISADSRQVYRGMNIGTGKDYDEYISNGRQVAIHLTDIADPGYKYNVFEYQRDFKKVYYDLKKRNVFPVVCGGSGMYIDSIISGYRMPKVPPDMELRTLLENKSMEELITLFRSFREPHNITDIDNKKRLVRAIEIEYYISKNPENATTFPVLNPLVIGVKVERDLRRYRISQRLKMRLDAGMIDEVKNLLDSGVGQETLIYYGLEYKYITLYLTGKIQYDEMVRSLETAIHQFAKRQMTWFRGMEKKGVKINWIDGLLPVEQKAGTVMKLLYEK